jgi:stage II sporulation protein D
VVAAALLGLVATAAPASAPASTAAERQERRPAGVTVVGNGYGHGHGMSQWGAQGAAQKGLGTQAILRFYYPTLKPGKATGNVSVLISGDTSPDVVVLDRPGLRVTALDGGRTTRLDSPAAARRWRLSPVSGGDATLLEWRGATGGWKRSRTLRGEAQFAAGGAPITLVTPTERRAYRGVLRSARPTASSRTRDTVNVLPLESYLKGVVPREVYTSWNPAALRAQAVAARTYAAFDRRDANARHYQICDTTQCQVYGGATDEVASTNRAIDQTRHDVLTYRGKPAFTQFSASNGGQMAAGSQPYLVAKKDPYDTAYRGWRDPVSAGEIERALPAIGSFRSVRVLERDGKGAYGGRVVRIRVVGSRASTVISGDDFRSFFGLRSTLFKIA